MVNLAKLYHSPGLGFWGLVIGVIGLVFGAISVYYSRSADLNAKKATHAANEARRSVITVSLTAELALVQQVFIELRLRLERSQWEQVSENCGRIRNIVAPAIRSRGDLFTDETLKDLRGLQSQIAKLQELADRIQLKNVNHDPAKMRQIVANEAETISVALGEVRRSLE